MEATEGYSPGPAPIGAVSATRTKGFTERPHPPRWADSCVGEWVSSQPPTWLSVEANAQLCVGWVPAYQAAEQGVSRGWTGLPVRLGTGRRTPALLTRASDTSSAGAGRSHTSRSAASTRQPDASILFADGLCSLT